MSVAKNLLLAQVTRPAYLGGAVGAPPPNDPDDGLSLAAVLVFIIIILVLVLGLS